MIGIGVRLFTKRKDDVCGLPIKQIAGFNVVDNIVRRCTAKEMADAHNHDSLTGNPVPPEPAVEFI